MNQKNEPDMLKTPKEKRKKQKPFTDTRRKQKESRRHTVGGF